MVNVLQIIANMPLFSLSFPANVQVVFNMIIQATNFSFYSTETLEDFMFTFTSTNSFNQNFNMMGFSGTNLVDNLGTMFWNIPLLMITYLALAAFKRVTRSSEK